MNDKDKKDINHLCEFIEDDTALINEIADEQLEDVHSFLKENGVESLETVSVIRHRVNVEASGEGGAFLDQLRYLLSQFGSRPALSFSLAIAIGIIGLQFYYPETPPPVERGIKAPPVDPSVDVAAEQLEGLHAQIMELYADGRFTEAEPLVQQALSTVEEIHGTDHPDTANALNNLAVVEKRLGKYDAAGAHYQRALTIQKQQLGATHPGTLTTMRNLGLLFEETGRYQQAESIYKDIFETHKTEFGTNDTRTIDSRNNLIEFYRKFGNTF